MQARLTLGLAAAALVVALLGSTPLGHALASQVPRNSVGSLQLKRNAVTARKISPNAVRTGHVLDGSLLAADFKAGQLPAGPKGDKGDAGPPGVSERQIVVAESANDSTSVKAVQASCPAGKQVVGGGANIVPISTLTAIVRSFPISSGWAVAASEINAVQAAWKVSAYAVCAKVS